MAARRRWQWRALGSTTDIIGTINNQGNFQVNGGSGSNTVLQLLGNTTLQGGGTVTLSTAGGGNNAIIQQGSGPTSTTPSKERASSGMVAWRWSIRWAERSTRTPWALGCSLR